MTGERERGTQPAPWADEQAQQVLRYWLASLRLEEALSARPRARRVRHPALPPRVDLPTPGQDYFKVALDGRALPVVVGQGRLRRELDPELGAFFESFLYRRYRRADEDGEGVHLLCFPVLHLRRGELGGILRRRVQLRFTDPRDVEFAVPTPSARRRKQWPSPPTALTLEPSAQTQADWPYFLDTRLLHHQLGLTSEAIDALFQRLREAEGLDAKGMLGVVTDALEAELGEQPKAPPSEPLPRLQAAVAALLDRMGRGVRSYPFAIVVDAAQAKTTWHLQKDILSLTQDEAPWPAEGPLAAYLGGERALTMSAPQRALGPGPAMTARQREVVECGWGSSLSAVQGPPGTGKTTLIQHLCAEFLLRQVEGLADQGRMGTGLMLVVSSNNRAVDQVVDPLSGLEPGIEGVLPLALRVGSRRVCEEVLARQLRRAALFLATAVGEAGSERQEALEQALAAFRALRDRVADALRPRAQAMRRNGERQRLDRALSASEPQATAAEGSLSPSALSSAEGRAAVSACEVLVARLEALIELCSLPGSLSALRAAQRHAERTLKKQWAACAQRLSAVGIALPPAGLRPDLPPSTDPAELLGCWQEAAELALEQVAAIATRLRQAQHHAQAELRARRLRAQLADLGPQEEVAQMAVAEADQRALFDAAVAVRAAWARAQAETLLPLVERFLHAASESRSPRVLARDPGAWLELQRLFGVWGCTLLSLGNCIPPQPGAIARLVIDEAGQCHPAHAVSGLLRAQAALVVGDVHQLTPVIELKAEEDERLLRQVGLDATDPRLQPYRIHGQSGNSTQSIADLAVERRLSLVDHFRCQPEIIALCDQLCSYGFSVHTEARSRVDRAPWLTAPLGFVEVQGEQERLGGSWFNAAEVEAAVELLRALLRSGLDVEDLSLITPYRGQLEQIRRALTQGGIPIEASAELEDTGQASLFSSRGVALGTVHRFQGGERSVVLFSTVVSAPRSLGFMNQEKNLLNVAISRAQHHLVCLGQRRVLAQGYYTGLLARAAHELPAPLAPRPAASPPT